MKRLFLALLVALVPTVGWGPSAFSQATVVQGGSWTAGRVPMYSSSGGGSQPIIQQSAPASGGEVSIAELSLVARGAGAAPFSGQGTGYLGSIWCLYDGPTSGPYHQLCMSPNATGSTGLISYNAFGGASALPLVFNINGVNISLPGAVSGVVTNYTSNQTLTVDQSYQTFTNAGSVGTITLTLPTPVAGLEFTFVVASAQTLNIDVGGSVVIAVGEIPGTAGGGLTSNATYSTITLKAISSTLWVTTGTLGSWTPT